MLFTTYTFALFVLGAFVLYWLAGTIFRVRWAQNVLLILLSYGFYALFDWRWCLLLAGVTGTGLLGGYLLGRDGSHRRLILVLVLSADLVALGIFKYLDFFADAVASVLGALGIYANQVTLDLVLPVGISYYVFQNLSFVIDVYRKEISGRVGLLEYGAALSFFPQLLAGPITRPRDLVPQLSEQRSFDDQRARDGLRQILWGLVKKLIIADGIGILVDDAWADIAALDGLALFLVAVLYSFQIYCDFSGYADIAIGTAKLFNLQLSKNFDRPYLSTSVRDFWRRWHMTLASWMRDYVYIPLGGSRCGLARRTLNVLVTFAVVGLWHGADVTFLIWGLLHGVYLATENVVRAWRGSVKTAPKPEAGGGTPGGFVGRLLAGAAVFVLVTFAWIFFRAASLHEALSYMARSAADPFSGSVEHFRYVPMLVVSAALLAFEWLTPTWEHGLSIRLLPLPVRWGVYLALCIALVLFAQFGGREGIYVQF